MVMVHLTNRKWFSVVCTPVNNDILHHSGQNVVDSRDAGRGQNPDTKKGQTLSVTFSQYDWFISQNERS